MKLTLLFFTFFLFSIKGIYGQNNPEDGLSTSDSLRILHELKSLLDSSEAPHSYTSISVSISDRYFSIHNNSINSKQTSTSSLVFNPQIGYFHKSGFNLSAGAFLLNEKGKGFGANQYSVTPGFDLLNNKNFDVSISYTHYFVNDKFSPYSSPIQNDFYGFMSYKKTWIEPGIALGYSTGEYKQVRRLDTAIAGSRRKLYDSATFKLKAFTMTLTAGHSFEFQGVLNKSDQLVFQPMLMLNSGSSETSITHKTNVPPGIVNFLYKKGKLPKLVSNSFHVESLGLNLDLSYAIGKFTFTPQLYLDYYLQNEDIDKFSYNFNFNIGFSF